MGPFSIKSMAQIGPISWHMTVFKRLEQFEIDANFIPSLEIISLSYNRSASCVLLTHDQ